jgi:hypothetical protein
LRSVFSSSVVTSRQPDVLIGSAVGPSRSSGTRAALFSQVGLDWQLGGGFAVDSSSGSTASMDNSSQVAQLLQATTDGLNVAPLGTYTIAADVAGDAAAAPPSSVMNSHLFTLSPRRRARAACQEFGGQAPWRP